LAIVRQGGRARVVRLRPTRSGGRSLVRRLIGLGNLVPDEVLVFGQI
jgi:hypothetical protein